MTPIQIGEILEARGASDDEIDAHLAHFGVPGMKWGQRRAERKQLNEAIKTAKSNVDLAKQDLNTLKDYRRQQRTKTAKKVVAVGAAATVIAAGAVATAKILNNKGSTPIAQAKQSYKFMAAGKDWIVQTNSGQAFETTMKALHERKALLG